MKKISTKQAVIGVGLITTGILAIKKILSKKNKSL